MKDLLSVDNPEYIEMFKENNNPYRFSISYSYVLLVLYTIATMDRLHGQIEQDEVNYRGGHQLDRK